MRMVAPRTGAPEIAVAENQPEYLVLTAACYGDNADAGPVTLLTRWRLTDDERARIVSGEDLYLAVATFGQPLQPVHVQIGADGWECQAAPTEDAGEGTDG